MDTTTGKRTSLHTKNEDEAQQLVEAKNNSERQPVLNLQIAKAYLAGSDKGITTRTCPERFAMEHLGHNSKAVHRAYARRAQVKIPSLEEYERQTAAKTI